MTSGSTARTDRQEKRLAYLSLDSLEEYVIVEQSEMKATIYRRVSDWQPMETERGDAVLEFQSLGVTLTFAEIYERVDWTRNDEPPLGL